MPWITIPNEQVYGFSGRAVKTIVRDNDGEVVYKPIRCPSATCGAAFTNLLEYQGHMQEEHGHEPEIMAIDVSATQETRDANAADVILDVLIAYQSGLSRRDSPFAGIQKTNDGMHSLEAWRRASLAQSRGDGDIRLKQAQYEWLRQLLDRRLPAKEKKAEGEGQTVAMALWGLSEYAIRQHLTTLPDRQKPETDEGLGSEREPAQAEA